MKTSIVVRLCLAAVLPILTASCSEEVARDNTSSGQASQAVPTQAVQINTIGESDIELTTPQDWVRSVDALMIIEVDSEEPFGNVNGVTVPRKADLRVVGEPVWLSVRGKLHRTPESVSVTLAGWKGRDLAEPFVEVTKEDVQDLTPIGYSSQPRLHTGHTYIAGFAWTGTSYEWLGGLASLPYDEGVIGRGEFEGQVVSAEAFQGVVPGGSLAEAVAGSSADGLSKLMTRTASRQLE